MLVERSTGEESEDNGIWSSRLQKRGFARTGHARDRARPGQAHWQGKLDSNLREARANHGARKTFVRECRSLRRAGVHNAEIRSGAEHADLCRLARARLVRARGRAA